MAEWYQAVLGSKAYRDLEQDMAVVENTEGLDIEEVGRTRAYVFEPTELFARSYAQWVATETGDETVLGQIAEIRDSKYAVERYTQWDSEDFKPIGDALSKVFQAKGWKKGVTA